MGIGSGISFNCLWFRFELISKMEFDSITKRHFGDSYDSCSESYDSYDSYGESYDSYDSCSESIDSLKLNEYELFIRHVVSTNFSEEANVSNSNLIYIPYS